ncbi:MAG: DUF302 domain-containing protein [Candidatus Xenobia bacterium]
MTTNVAYCLEKSIAGPFAEAVEAVKAAFKAEGFGNLTEIDVTRVMQEKTGEQMEPYRILGMCNPQLAHRAISAEHTIGVMLPCNVLVHQCGNEVRIAAADPRRMMQMIGNPELATIATEVGSLIDAALQRLG